MSLRIGSASLLVAVNDVSFRHQTIIFFCIKQISAICDVVFCLILLIACPYTCIYTRIVSIMYFEWAMGKINRIKKSVRWVFAENQWLNPRKKNRTDGSCNGHLNVKPNWLKIKNSIQNPNNSQKEAYSAGSWWFWVDGFAKFLTDWLCVIYAHRRGDGISGAINLIISVLYCLTRLSVLVVFFLFPFYSFSLSIFI